jgi:hypothetical protein
MIHEDYGREEVTHVKEAWHQDLRLTVSLVHIEQFQMRSSAHASLDHPEFADRRAKWTLEFFQLTGLTVKLCGVGQESNSDKVPAHGGEHPQQRHRVVEGCDTAVCLWESWFSTVSEFRT